MPNSVRLSKRFVFIQTLADASQNLFLGEYLTETLEHVGPSGGGFDARIDHVHIVGELSSYPAPYPGDTNN